jgi:hypothetical protein
MKFLRGALVAVLLAGVMSGPAFSANKPGVGTYSAEDIEKMEKAVKSGKTVSLGKGQQWSVSETGETDPEAVLAKFENLPGGKYAVKAGRYIISMYKFYLCKMEAFIRDIGL